MVKIVQTFMIFLFWINELNCLMNQIFQFVLKLLLWKTYRCFYIFIFFVKWISTRWTTWFLTDWIYIFDSAKYSHVSFQINNLLHLLFPNWLQFGYTVPHFNIINLNFLVIFLQLFIFLFQMFQLLYFHFI